MSCRDKGIKNTVWATPTTSRCYTMLWRMERIQNQNAGFAQLALLLLGRCPSCCWLCVFSFIWNRQLIYEKKKEKKGRSQWNWQIEWHTVLLISCPSLGSKWDRIEQTERLCKGHIVNYKQLLIGQCWLWLCWPTFNHRVTALGQRDVKQSAEGTIELLLPLIDGIGCICHRM